VHEEEREKETEKEEKKEGLHGSGPEGQRSVILAALRYCSKATHDGSCGVTTTTSIVRVTPHDAVEREDHEDHEEEEEEEAREVQGPTKSSPSITVIYRCATFDHEGCQGIAGRPMLAV
jgi:hypothetical protein